jgi:hypothetical protein
MGVVIYSYNSIVDASEIGTRLSNSVVGSALQNGAQALLSLRYWALGTQHWTLGTR